MTARLRRAAAAIAALLVLAFAAFAGYWVLTGGRWYVVETPSMGTAAPVGTLLWVEPLGHRRVHVGEFVSFRPPGSLTVYSHRIYRIEADGSMRTRGQITAPDPWRIQRSDIVGTVSMRWWGVGWLVKAAPVLILGALALTLLLRMIAREYRPSVALVGSSLVLCIAIVVWHPLTGAVQLTGQTAAGGHASYVSTGLLPMRLELPGDRHVDLASGETATVDRLSTGPARTFSVRLLPQIPLWWWFALLVPWFLPALWTTVRGGAGRIGPRHRAIPA